MSGINKKNTNINKMCLLVLAVFAAFFVDRFSCYITDRLIDGYGNIWLIVHHTLQLLLVLIIMSISVWGRSLKQWGINVSNAKKTLRILRLFAIGWVICTTIYILVTQALSGWPALIDFTLTPQNISSYFFFEFIIVGISEEILFRGLVMGILSRSFNQKIKIAKTSISVAGLITAILFALAHIAFTLSPFQITHVEPIQIIIALSLGVFYAVLYERTGSLLGPILAHNIADGWLSVLYILISVCVK